MLSISIAEVNVIHAGLEILVKSSLEYIPSKKSATSPSWSYFRRSALKSPSSTTVFFSFNIFSKYWKKMIVELREFHWRMTVNAPYDHVISWHSINIITLIMIFPLLFYGWELTRSVWMPDKTELEIFSPKRKQITKHFNFEKAVERLKLVLK